MKTAAILPAQKGLKVYYSSFFYKDVVRKDTQKSYLRKKGWQMQGFSPPAGRTPGEALRAKGSLAAKARHGDAHLLAVFCHGAPRHGQPLLLETGGQGFVG